MDETIDALGVVLISIIVAMIVAIAIIGIVFLGIAVFNSYPVGYEVQAVTAETARVMRLYKFGEDREVYRGTPANAWQLYFMLRGGSEYRTVDL